MTRSGLDSIDWTSGRASMASASASVSESVSESARPVVVERLPSTIACSSPVARTYRTQRKHAFASGSRFTEYTRYSKRSVSARHLRRRRGSRVSVTAEGVGRAGQSGLAR